MRYAAALVLVGALATSRLSFAQADVSTKAAAEGLFDQGRELMRSGDFASACGYFERSQQIDPAVGTLLYLGECYEKSGRTASAWATFREAASSARAVGQFDRAKLGDERADRLTPKLSRLSIDVNETTRGLPGLAIRREGQTVPAAAWNVAVPLDPGEYRIDVSAPGYQDYSAKVQVAPGATTTRVTVPALAPAPGGAGAAAGLPAQAEPAQPHPSPQLDAGAHAASSESPHDSGKTQRTLAYVAGGVGVAAVAVGSVFGLRAMSKNDEAKDLCPRGDRQCDDPSALTLTDEASSAATISNITFALGGAALAGAVVLFLTAPDGSSESNGTLGASLTPSGIWLKGTF